MSRFVTITNSRSARFGERKGAMKTRSGIGRVTLSFFLVALICALGVYYVFEVNNLATKGIEIDRLQKNIQELQKKNERLQIEAAELRSMYKIEEKTRDLNMVVPMDISYISLPGDVAIK